MTPLSRLIRLEITERRGILDSVPALLPYHPDEFNFSDEGVWVRPNDSLTAQAIRSYALTFEGYDYARQKDFDLRAFANERRERFEETGEWAGTFEELRYCLFFEQRRWRWGAEDDSDDAMFVALNHAICSAWDREWPSRCAQLGNAQEPES
jgi:hypothetical protein